MGSSNDLVDARFDGGKVTSARPLPVQDAATLAKQESIRALVAGLGTEATLTAIKTALQAQVDLSATLWTDDSGAFYVRRDVVDQESGTVTVSFTDPAGTAATPGAGLRPASNEEALTSIQTLYNVVTTNGGGGYTAGDVVVRQVVLNENAVPPTVVAATWLNLTTGAVIAAPTSSHLKLSSKDVALAAGSAVVGKVGVQVAGADVARVNAVPVNAVGFDSAGNPLPADFDSCAWTPGYDASGNMITMTVVASTGTYVLTITYSAGRPTNYSAWVKQ